MAYKSKYKGSEIDAYLTKAKEMSETLPNMIEKSNNNLQSYEERIAGVLYRFDKISSFETKSSSRIDKDGTIIAAPNATWEVVIFDISHYRGKYIKYSNSVVYNNYLSYSISSDISFSKENILGIGGTVTETNKIVFIPENSSYIAVFKPTPSKTIYGSTDIVEFTRKISTENEAKIDILANQVNSKSPTIIWEQGGFAANGNLVDRTYGVRSQAISGDSISVPFSIIIKDLNSNCKFKIRGGSGSWGTKELVTGVKGDILKIADKYNWYYFYVETTDQSNLSVDSLILDYELISFDKCVSRDDLVTLENQLGLDKYVALFGDSLSQGPNKFIRNYFDQIGYKWSNNAIGGETSTIMASRIGAGTAIVDEEVVIPESGSVNVKLVSSLVDSEFNNLPWSMRSNKGLTGSVGYSPVTINGILGDLETSSVGIVMFDSSGKVVHKGSSNSGSTLTLSNMSGTPTSYIICCNKGKEGEAHINLNNSEVDVAAICTIQNARLKADGTTEYNENYTCSEVIPISSFQNIYYDALATQDKPTFSRRESGQVEYVAKGSPVISNQCHLFDKTINIMFINNFTRRTGTPIEEDYVFQFKQMAERNLNKKYIVATTYWFARDGVEDTANKIIKSMRQSFGMHYIDFYGYFKNSSINDAIAMGLITESEASGKTWEQLFMGGDIHQNEKGSYLCARQIIKKGIELGYWDEGDYSWDAIYSAT